MVLVEQISNPLLKVEGAHWFAGDGMLHAFHIEAGQVHYRNRWVRTARYEYARQHGRYPAGGALGGNGSGEAIGKHDGTANTNVVVRSRDPQKLAAVKTAIEAMLARVKAELAKA